MKDIALLIIDSTSNLMAFKEVLSKLDVICIKAKSGKEAFNQLHKNDISLILLDEHSPKMNGYEILI